MKTSKELHEEAIRLYEDALVARFKKNDAERERLLLLAFHLERQAALMLKERFDLEPTRSNLFASAATIAKQAGLNREAEQMIGYALTGNPKPYLREELIDMLEEINFYRHLTTAGVVLDMDELRFSIASGNAVAKGLVMGNEILPRLKSINHLYEQTSQRLAGIPYKQTAKKQMKQNQNFYLGIPEAASYAVVMKFTRSDKTTELPGLETTPNNIDEMLACITLLNNKEYNQLRVRINNNDYFTNFVHTAQKIAPDGSNVKLVGFTVSRNNEEKVYAFNNKKSDIEAAINELESADMPEQSEIITTLQGRLVIANALNNFIQLKANSKKTYKIHLTNKAQKEIVQTHYAEQIVMKVKLIKDNEFEFVSIE